MTTRYVPPNIPTCESEAIFPPILPSNTIPPDGDIGLIVWPSSRCTLIDRGGSNLDTDSEEDSDDDYEYYISVGYGFMG
jgi:hypothetical protein